MYQKSLGNLSPSRKLLEAGVDVREAARTLAKISIAWDTPQNIVIVAKPQEDVIPNARLVVEVLSNNSKY